MEDITEIMEVAAKLADHSNRFEERMAERTGQIENNISALEKEVDKIKTKIKVL